MPLTLCRLLALVKLPAPASPMIASSSSTAPLVSVTVPMLPSLLPTVSGPGPNTPPLSVSVPVPVLPTTVAVPPVVAYPLTATPSDPALSENLLSLIPSCSVVAPAAGEISVGPRPTTKGVPTMAPLLLAKVPTSSLRVTIPDGM